MKNNQNNVVFCSGAGDTFFVNVVDDASGKIRATVSLDKIGMQDLIQKLSELVNE